MPSRGQRLRGALTSFAAPPNGMSLISQLVGLTLVDRCCSSQNDDRADSLVFLRGSDLGEASSSRAGERVLVAIAAIGH